MEDDSGTFGPEPFANRASTPHPRDASDRRLSMHSASGLEAEPSASTPKTEPAERAFSRRSSMHSFSGLEAEPSANTLGTEPAEGASNRRPSMHSLFRAEAAEKSTSKLKTPRSRSASSRRMSISSISGLIRGSLSEFSKPTYDLEVPESGYKIIQYTGLPADHVYAQKTEPDSSTDSPVKTLIKKTKGLFMSPSKKQRQQVVETTAPMFTAPPEKLDLSFSDDEGEGPMERLDDFIARFPDFQADPEEPGITEPGDEARSLWESTAVPTSKPKTNMEGGIRLLTPQPAPVDMDDALVPQRDLGPGLFADDGEAHAVLVRGIPDVVRVQPSNKWPRLNPNGPVLNEYGETVYRKELENVSGGRLLTFKKSNVTAKQRAKLSMAKMAAASKNVVRKTNKWYFAGRFVDLATLDNTLGVVTTQDLTEASLATVSDRHGATGLPLRTLRQFAKQNLSDESALLPALRTFLAFVHNHIMCDCPSLDAYEIQICCIKARKNDKDNEEADDIYRDDFCHWTRDDPHQAPLRIGTSLIGDSFRFQKELELAVQMFEEEEAVPLGGERAKPSWKEKKFFADMLADEETDSVGKGQLAFWYALPHERAAVYAVAPKGDGGERIEVILRVGEESKLKQLTSWMPGKYYHPYSFKRHHSEDFFEAYDVMISHLFIMSISSIFSVFLFCYLLYFLHS
ncbi:hypothetical protein K490DRAFT_63742 [Saccharata proteae CBS 121410]|uniref:Uncharacterized protein n=1 Tax=Saccharata proteae CBS 121410 TaxID=1314787 RepID=A0A6A5YDQ1_9PEZI|nr:hypothetical protein K490DRAFT_63742 [Saccharata proteae CBS 121410]